MKIVIDFDILPSSSKTIRVYDSSDWEWAKDNPSSLLIIPPGSSKCITVPFQKNEVNTINSNDLNLGCNLDLSDGMYEITLTSGFTTVNKTINYLKTDACELRMAKTVIEYNEAGKVTDAFKNSIIELNWELLLAKSYTKEGNISKAMNIFNKYKSAVEQLNCNC